MICLQNNETVRTLRPDDYEKSNIVTVTRLLKGELSSSPTLHHCWSEITLPTLCAWVIYVQVSAPSYLKPRGSLIICGQTRCSISAIYLIQHSSHSHHIFAVRREPLSVPSQGPGNAWPGPWTRLATMSSAPDLVDVEDIGQSRG